MAVQKLTLLHSNDMHGAFLPKEVSGRMSGGLPLLSGYIKKTRKEEDNVLYAIAGDMFRGSIIDSEYLGLSTIDLVNVLAPDVASLGNHEADYGIAHLLFLEKCATFPIICANLFVTLNNARLFTPYRNVEVGGMRILFIGILTEEVLASTKTEKVIGTFIDIDEAAREVGVICDNYRTKDTDLTVLLTHIGLEKDKELASKLNPDFGVDLIIGGHSHTFMGQPEYVNDIPIVQAGTGTGILGRFDIFYDTLTHEICDLQWQCVPINEDTAEADPVMEQILEGYRSETDKKYKRVLTRLARTLTHPARNQETELGNLYADMLQDESSFDIMLMGSGSIRKEEFGPIVEYQDMLENTPFDDLLWMLKVTGAQFRRMVRHILRDEAWEGHTEFYQFSKGVHIVYRKSTHELEKLEYNGEEIRDDQELLIALQNYHYTNFDEFLGVPLAEVRRNMKPRVIATAVNNIFEEYLSTHPGLDAKVEGRITILE
ncbi:MAG: bifunctional metallophosphatase/5'-nucleotidase [Erysipelotrichaceae bacterium]|nr:bifunctional metallophosphatase/5'-nucleotidase [Erysipelotrichaceae bacterium]MBR2552800.1 bifunctional metallophosphatase/5'-nucleotidase [Erysipelotrichaceae bacterium]MBR4121824.1 bifunctional metallophosphatase/5'-nucleotidase [Erysipelotrichaceae bacterium]